MREITNRHNLPAPFIETAKKYAAKYDKGGADISATQLGEPPRIIALKNRHGAEIVEDASDLLYVIDGQIVHAILESAAAAAVGGYVGYANDPPDIKAAMAKLNSQFPVIEKRFSAEFKKWRVSGQVDYFDPTTGTLSDYKRVSVYSRKRGPKDEWLWQLNVLAELLRQNGHEVKKLEAIRWYRDWSPSAKAREQDYPEIAVETVPIELWPQEKARAWIEERVELHQLAAMVADDAELPMCTEIERWNPGRTYAVMQPGRKSALRVLSTQAEAASWVAQNVIPGLSIVERVGEDRRCRMYCSVNVFCSYFQKTYGKSERATAEEVTV